MSDLWSFIFPNTHIRTIVLKSDLKYTFRADYYGRNVYTAIVKHNDLKLVKSLSAKEILFEIAIIENKPLVIKYLLPEVNPADSDDYAIRAASSFGFVDVVRLLLADKRTNPSADHNHAIYIASRNGHAEIVKLLLADKRVDPSDEANHPIRGASLKGHAEVVRLLLADKRVDPSADGNFPIFTASSNGHAEIVKLILADKRVDPTINYNDPLMQAANTAIRKSCGCYWPTSALIRLV
jgi:hypothetical protein